MAKLYAYQEKHMRLNHTLDPEPAPHSFRMHNHSKLELYCFLSGRGIYHIEGSEYPLEPGDVLVLSPSESHYIELDQSLPYERVVLHFSEDFIKPFDPELYLLKPFLSREPGKGNLYKSFEFPGGSRSFFEAMTAEIGDSRINILSGAIPLLNHITRLFHSRPDAPETETTQYRIVRYVNRNLTGPLSLDEICDRFYISRSQLGRLFRQATGTTLWQYVTVKRLTRARELIRAGEHPTHVYARCGFSDYSTFYRAYKKHFGVSPREK